MAPTYEVEVVPLQEARHDVRAKRERYAAFVLRPAGDVLVRVRPQQVTEHAFTRCAKRATDTDTQTPKPEPENKYNKKKDRKKKTSISGYGGGGRFLPHRHTHKRV
jgi:hypothetical protein